MYFDAILGTFFDAMGGVPLFFFMLSAILVVAISAALIRPFLSIT